MIRLTVLVLLLAACGSTIRGVVRDKPTGNPLSSASVAIGDKDAVTNAYGVYVIEDVDVNSSSVIMINAPGYYIYSASVNKNRNDEDEIVRDVELVPKAEITPRK